MWRKHRSLLQALLHGSGRAHRDFSARLVDEDARGHHRAYHQRGRPQPDRGAPPLPLRQALL
jgi:hypothetical protein